MSKNLKPAIVVLAISLYTPLAFAENPALLELLKVLHAQGTLDDATYAKIQTLLVHEEQTEVREYPDANLPATTIVAEQDSAELVSTKQEPVQENNSPSINTKGKLEVTSPEGDFKFRVGGRIMLDAAAYDSDITPLGSGTEMRRARLFISGAMWDVWKYKLQYDFTGSGRGGINDAYLQYTGLKQGSISAGHMKEPFSLQNMTSSKYTTFIERSLPYAFSSGRNIGLMYNTGGENWTAAGGLFGKGLDTPGGEVDEGYGLAARVTYAPIYGDGKAVHFGLGLAHREIDDNSLLRFRERPESHITDIRLVDTGRFDAESFNLYGLEFAWLSGPFSLQGEYMKVDVERDTGTTSDVSFGGYYVETGWFLTGESLNYNPEKGTMGKISPQAIFGQNGFGAWQLALRFSSLDLSDEDINGGEQQDLSAGLNWYPNANLRFSANYIKVLDLDGGSNAGDEPGAFVVRGQIEF